MKVKKEITEHIDVDVMVEGITLLSVEEYEKYTRDIPGDAVYNYLFGVRPALKINLDSSNLKIGDKILFQQYRWTVISSDYILCDEVVIQMPFRGDLEADDANDWEASDVKKRLEEWFRMERKERDYVRVKNERI